MAKAIQRMTEAELKGRKVRLKREIRNGGGRIFGAGTEMTITGKWAGLELVHVNTCPTCGCGDRHSIRKVDYTDVELLPESTEE